MEHSRIALVVGPVVVALVVVIAALAAGGSGGDGDKPEGERANAAGDGPPRTVRAELTLERFEAPATGQMELLVSLTENRLNVPETTGGETTVSLRCLDESGAEVFDLPTGWPLLEELGYPAPHIHQPAGQAVLDRIRGCRLTGPGIDFEGRVPGRLPEAGQ